MTSKPAPVACELSAHDAEEQLREWADLQRHALRSTSLSSGVEMVFPSSLTAEIASLVERESVCCGFLDVVTSHGDADVSITITSDDPAALAVIAALSGVDLS
jgi:hypothetical protein